MYAGIETGGTKTVCAVGENGTVRERVQFPTGRDPEALLRSCAEFLAPFAPRALGIGTFGPCDSDPASPDYGQILATPKPGWAGADVLHLLRRDLAVPMVMTTDVNAAALGELRHGCGRGYSDLVYLTIGTGIGGGVVSGGGLLHGARHPEMGHMLLPDSHGDGICPFHGPCFEGLASGPAMQARYGRPAQDIGDGDPAWDVQARIVADGLHNITLSVAPQCLVISGGVGSRSALHDRLRTLLDERLAGYVPTPVIRRAELGADAGVVGAMTLAQESIQG